MSVKSYREQRKKIPDKELAKHRGKWVAFSRDGTEVIASAKRLVLLEKRLQETGKDPQEVILEFLGTGEIVLGAAELL